MITPLTPKSERIAADKVRLFAYPKYARLDGRTYRPIADLVTTRYDTPTQTFRVECGDEWIEITPKINHTGVSEVVVNRSGHFGWLLDPAQAPDAVEYAITHSGGVNRGTAGWELAAADGVSIGLFLNDWRQRFGTDVVVDTAANKVMLDLRNTKTAIAAGRPLHKGILIDLDPTIALSGDASYLEWYVSTGDFEDAAEAWGEIRDQLSADYREDNILYMVGYAQEEGDTSIARGSMRFDTSGYPAVSAAVLYLYWEDVSPGTSDQAHVARCYFTNGPNHNNAYGKVRSGGAGGYENKSYGAMVSTYPGSAWATKDILAHYEGRADFDLGLAHETDVNNTVTEADETVGFTADGGNGPYIEVTEITGPPSGSMALMDAGK